MDVNSLLILVPSRGRPDNAKRLMDTFETAAIATVLFGLDEDDPDLFKYDVPAIVGPRLGMCGTLNAMAINPPVAVDYIGFMGDDHLPRGNWDTEIFHALNQLNTGIVYGNDLFQGPNLPTAVFMTSDIVNTLGYMAPPCLRHMYLDNFWKDLGEATRRLRYLPNVIIEHMHPEAGKSEVDDRYEDVWPLMGPDREAYEQYKASGGFDADVAKIKGIL